MRALEQLRDALESDTSSSPAAQLLRRTVPEMYGRLGELRETLETALHSIRRGMHITGQILEYSQVSALRPDDSTVNISDVVRAVLAECSGVIKARGIEAHSDIATDIMFPIREDHVHAILRNLVENACHALGEAPAGQRRLVLSSQAEASGVVLVVEDSGPGISEANQGRIFQPFFSTKGSAGTGLGLGMSRKLAQIYGGDLAFVSSPAAGTRFKLLLPTRGRKGPIR